MSRAKQSNVTQMPGNVFPSLRECADGTDRASGQVVVLKAAGKFPRFTIKRKPD